MAADLTVAGFTILDLSDPSYDMANMGVRAAGLGIVGVEFGAKLNMSDFSGGSGGGGSTRPSNGFLYPRGDC